MIIKNGLVFQENKTFQKKDLYIENGIITEKAQICDTTVLDAEGLYVLPGLVDVHSHGAAGHDFSDADSEGLKEILRYEYACGITSYCPATMTLPETKLREVFASLHSADAADGKKKQAHIAAVTDGKTERTNIAAVTDGKAKQAHIAGIHMEGPFIAAGKCGAHDKSHIRLPDVSFFRECNAACGNQIRLVTLAPELPGAMEFIREVCGETMVSLGHTNADYEISKAALQAGAHHITHMYNAMRPFAHREPGLIGAAMDNAQCMTELICDGIHVHESAVRAAFAMFPGRVVLISDSMRAAGLPDGCYELGGQQVYVKGRRAVLSDGTIAGSAANLYDCMRTAVSFGIPVWEAVSAASMNPAKSIGIYDKAGSLKTGKRADILLADAQLNLIKVL